MVSGLAGCDFLKKLAGKGAGKATSQSRSHSAASQAPDRRAAAAAGAGETGSFAVPGEPNCLPVGRQAQVPAVRSGSGILESLAQGQRTAWDGSADPRRTLGGGDGRTVMAGEDSACRPRRPVLAAYSVSESYEVGEEPPAPAVPPAGATGAVAANGSGGDIVKGGPVLMEAYYKFQEGAYKVAYAVLDRAGWGAQDPARVIAHHVPGRITVHHTAGHRGESAEDTAETVLGTQRLHMSYRINNKIVSKKEFARRLNAGEKAHFEKPWADIGYHFLIDGEGRVVQGRPTDLYGTHVADANRGNIGIALMGDFNEQRPAPAQIESLRRLSSYLAAKYDIDVLNRGAFIGHSHLNRTDCPGTRLDALLDVLRVEIAGRKTVLAA